MLAKPICEPERLDERPNSPQIRQYDSPRRRHEQRTTPPCLCRAQHLADDEPIGATRIRWFNGFAKIERTAFRKAYRGVRILKQTADFIFGHVAQKGYSKLVTLATPNYAMVWIRVLGFRQIAGRPPVFSGDGEPFVELVKDLTASADAISIDTDPNVLFRVEGSWHVPSAFEAGEI
jgi:hypothetical protein